MKKRLFAHIFYVCLVWIYGVGYAQEAPETWMPDAHLRAAVGEALGIPADAVLTQDDMLRLKRLEAGGKGIVDIKGLEYTRNLMYLHLGDEGNYVMDLSPLATLTSLVSLNVGGNQVSDLSPLVNLLNLNNLNLRDNQVSDLSPLTHLVNLIGLNVGGNQIVDVSPLADLVNLTGLSVGGNQVVDISPLSSLTSLEYLNLFNNHIKDVSPLANLLSLENLDLLGNEIESVLPLASLINLKVLILSHNRIGDFTPLVGLTSLRELWIRRNRAQDFSMLSHLNLTTFVHDEFCVFEPLALPVADRITSRSFPSVYQIGNDIVGREGDLEAIALHDLYWSAEHGLDLWTHWHLTEAEPTIGLSRALLHFRSMNEAKDAHQRVMDMNPDMVLMVGVIFDWREPDVFPIDSDFWLRDPDGNLIVHPWHGGEWLADLLNSDYQDLCIERAVAIAACGLFDGIFVDSLRVNGTGFYGREFYPEITEEQVIDAYTRIFSGIRERVRDDFLIIANVNRTKPTAYTQYLNGIHMETGHDANGSYTREGLLEIEDTLLWAQKHLQAPQITGLEGEGIGREPPDGPNNLRLMRAFTTMSLTLSDGYVLYTDGRRSVDPQAPHHAHIWHDFWDAPLGQPVGERAVLYETPKDVSIDGLFIREFTNGWAVYNRSGKQRMIQLPEKVSGVASGVEDKRWHTVPDLDGEIYLKEIIQTQPVKDIGNPADVNNDGVVNILDLVGVANAFGKDQPDLNADGVVNILDLILVAQQMEDSTATAAPSVFAINAWNALNPAMVQAWIKQAALENDGSLDFQAGIANLRRLLASLIPETTALLPNYPNPFNPETWIPYHLAKPSNVRINIYDTRGTLVRHLELGHQREGYYTNRGQAAYWDGRNAQGERVASGVYFYQLQADGVSALRKMLIVK